MKIEVEIFVNVFILILFEHQYYLGVDLTAFFSTMLFIIGLGLADEYDITLKGFNAIKSCSRIYLEAYTSILMVDKSKLVWKANLSNTIGSFVWQASHCRRPRNGGN